MRCCIIAVCVQIGNPITGFEEALTWQVNKQTSDKDWTEANDFKSEGGCFLDQ